MDFTGGQKTTIMHHKEMKQRLLSRTLWLLGLMALSLNSLHSKPATESANEFPGVLYLRKIGNLSLDHVSFKQAIEEIENHWLKAFPDQPFPVSLIEPDAQVAQSASAGNNITLELTDVPYIMALKYVCDLSGYELHDNGEMTSIQLAEHSEDLRTEVHSVSAKAKDSLHIAKDITRSALEVALRELDIEFNEPIMKAVWDDDSLSIIMHNTIEQHEKLRVILQLLDKNFSISKEKSN